MVKVKLNYGEVSSQLLKGEEIQQFVRDVAGDIRDRAGTRFEVVSNMHAKRTSSTVIDKSEDAIHVEAQQGNLTRALASMGVERRFGKRGII